jgi:putative membrane protein
VRRRRPARVYDVGEEPDPRFSLANERTFLAWIRTALSLFVAGLAVEALALLDGSRSDRTIGVALVATGLLTAGLAFQRWAVTERALRLRQPLPSALMSPVLAGTVVVVSAAALLLLA